ncbi:MAG: WG repeat-containing protein, partial [Flavobacteriaceae bacterium]|nr:WG repeat-containing protein [Flavobacteriaceae bacterium]
MKKILIILLAFSFAQIGAQELKEISFIAPFQEDLAAVKKNNKWGFMDKEGKLVVGFRSDLYTSGKKQPYPVFSSGLCQITKDKNGIPHYGYINPKGETVIEPEFVDASTFNNNTAIVLKVAKEVLGENELLGKKVVSYAYNEVLINHKGETVKHLRGPFNLLYDKGKTKDFPKIKSHFLNENLVAVPGEKNSWSVVS